MYRVKSNIHTTKESTMKKFISIIAALMLAVTFYQCESSSPFEPSDDGTTGSIPDTREVEKFSTNIDMSAEYYEENENTISNAKGLFSGAPLRGDLGGTMTAEINSSDPGKDQLVSTRHSGTGTIILDDGQVFDITLKGTSNPGMRGSINGTCQNGVLKLTGKYYEQQSDSHRSLVVTGQISYIDGATPPANDDREVL
jgi:hypothetical protein